MIIAERKCAEMGPIHSFLRTILVVGVLIGYAPWCRADSIARAAIAAHQDQL